MTGKTHRVAGCVLAIFTTLSCFAIDTLPDKSLTILSSELNYNKLQPYYYLEDLTVQDEVTYLEAVWFDPCPNLKSIDISGSSNYTSVDGVVYSADKTRVVVCPSGKTGEVNLPDEVKIIGDNAFANCTNLTKITNFKRATFVGSNAFTNCSVDPTINPVDPVDPAPDDPTAPTDLYPTNNGGTYNWQVAENYAGWLVDGDGAVSGTITAKFAKPKNGVAKVTVSVLKLENGKKVSFKGEANLAAGTATCTNNKEGTLTLNFGAEGMSGKWNGLNIVAGREVFATKKDGAALDRQKWVTPGVWTAVLRDADSGIVPISVSVAKKGKTKVTAVLNDGSKINISNMQAVTGEEGYAIPVVYSKKGVKLSFVMWFARYGTSCELRNLSSDYTLEKVSIAGILADGPHTANVVADEVKAILRGSVVEVNCLPIDEPFKVAGKKWTFNKATSVKYKDGVWNYGIDEAKGKTNTSGIKLSFTPKTASFKGSMKVYTLENGKLKKYTANINGVVVEGIGLGNAVIKKKGGFPIELK